MHLEKAGTDLFPGRYPILKVLPKRARATAPGFSLLKRLQ